MRAERRMRARVVTIRRDESVDLTPTLMAVHAIRQLPVLEGQRLAGISPRRAGFRVLEHPV